MAIAITCDATGSALCSWAAASVLRPGDDVRLLHASTGKAAPAEDADAAAAVRDGLVAATASLGGLTVAPPAALPAAGGAPCGACDAATTGPALCAWAPAPRAGASLICPSLDMSVFFDLRSRCAAMAM